MLGLNHSRLNLGTNATRAQPMQTIYKPTTATARSRFRAEHYRGGLTGYSHLSDDNVVGVLQHLLLVCALRYIFGRNIWPKMYQLDVVSGLQSHPPRQHVAGHQMGNGCIFTETKKTAKKTSEVAPLPTMISQCGSYRVGTGF